MSRDGPWSLPVAVCLLSAGGRAVPRTSPSRKRVPANVTRYGYRSTFRLVLTEPASVRARRHLPTLIRPHEHQQAADLARHSITVDPVMHRSHLAVCGLRECRRGTGHADRFPASGTVAVTSTLPAVDLGRDHRKVCRHVGGADRTDTEKCSHTRNVTDTGTLMQGTEIINHYRQPIVNERAAESITARHRIDAQPRTWSGAHSPTPENDEAPRRRPPRG